MPHKCKDMHEVVRLSMHLKHLGAPVHLHGLTVSSPDTKAFNRAMKWLKGQDTIRKAAESKSMMDKQENLL